MWHMTSLTADAGFSFFAWARVYQMIGLPFLFIPISTVSYSDVPANRTNQASSLINVARNLGGSIGVSLANNEIMTRSQFHQARLSEHAVPSSSSFQDTVAHVTQYFVSQGASLMDAQRRAIGWIGQIIVGQSTLMAYMDVFWMASLFALAMVPLALMLRSVSGHATAAGH
jgi:DHA2 family multidrug resistance protein